MGAWLGLLFGAGVLLVVRARTRTAPRTHVSSAWVRRREELLRQAGVGSVSSAQLLAMQAGCAIVSALIVLVVTSTVTVALCFGIIAFTFPNVMVRRMRNRRSVEFRELWPEVVDNLTSGIRAGLALPEALTALGERGPAPLRDSFRQFGSDYRASGRFADCLNRLESTLADPVGDRICETLRVAREVGGTDLGQVLRTLSAFLREDARTRAELETRQGWSINGARLAVAAPWLVLLLLGTQRATLRAYDSPAGMIVLLAGGVVCLLAYRVMIRIARLPVESRILRGQRTPGASDKLQPPSAAAA